MATGGPTSTPGVSTPTGWGYVLQTNPTPSFIGTWKAPATAGAPSSTDGLGVNTSTAGSWYDGSNGGFDGLYQGLFLDSGVTYTVSFSTVAAALGFTTPLTPIVELDAYTGACGSPCIVPASTGFTTLDAPPENITPAQPFFLASALGKSVNPVFQGGTLRMDQPGATYAQNFTLDDSTTNTIDEFGVNSIFSGVFSDAAGGAPGNIIIGDSAGGGSATFMGASTYTGTTTIDAGATLIIGAGGSITNASTLTNSGFLDVDPTGRVTVAEITNNATGTIDNFGAVAAALNNAGTVNNGGGSPAFAPAGSGTWTGDVLSNTGTVFNSGTWTGDVISNMGGLSNSGSWNAANFTNSAGGSVINTGTLTATASFTNTGSFETAGSLSAPLIGNTGTFDNVGAITGAVNNAGFIDNGGLGAPATSGTTLVKAIPVTIEEAAVILAAEAAGVGVWTGDVVSNTGQIVNSAIWNAANISNDVGGTFTSNGALTVTTALNNAGAFFAAGSLTTPLINNTGAFTVTGPLSGAIVSFNNSGLLQVDEGATLTAGGITNNAGGSIFNSGAITDALDNSGVVVNNGTFTADVNNLATGGITNNGVWNGDLLSNVGSISNNGTWTAANFINNAGGTVSTSGTLIATAIANAGRFNAGGSVTAPLVNNSGTFSATKRDRSAASSARSTMPAC